MQLNIVTFVEISRAISLLRDVGRSGCLFAATCQLRKVAPGASIVFAEQSKPSRRTSRRDKDDESGSSLSLTERSLRPSSLMGVSHRVKLRRRLIRIELSDRDSCFNIETDNREQNNRKSMK